MKPLRNAPNRVPGRGPRTGRGRAELRTNGGSYTLFRAVCVRELCRIACFFCGFLTHSVQFISHSARIGRRQHRLDLAPSGNGETGDERSRVPAPKVVEVAVSPEGLDDEAVLNWPSAQAKSDSQHAQPGWYAIGRNYKAPGTGTVNG